ncbi:hypothetical protein B0H14DRAFT_3172233 [Mycena olivaceomarginata]|nr:hypothetical protein B0H14DRAFT_3174755 [Mycena olivaceomarginata]KAJ7711126.1 hypothetical protein B0H14DRAFT_3172233 [Mycena olivaceomarginata]
MQFTFIPISIQCLLVRPPAPHNTGSLIGLFLLIPGLYILFASYAFAREHPVVERAGSDRKSNQVIQTPTINGVIVLVDATSSLLPLLLPLAHPSHYPSGAACITPPVKCIKTPTISLVPLGRKMMVAIYQILKSRCTSLQAKISSSLEASSFKFIKYIPDPNFQTFGAVNLTSLATLSIRVASSSTAPLAPAAAHTSDNDDDDGN